MGKVLLNMVGMALRALIDSVLERNGWNNTELTRAAARKGHKLNKQEVSTYRNEGMKQLSPNKVIALAAGLELPAYRVAVAVLEDLGIPMPLDMASPEQAIERDVMLPVSTKRMLLVILQQARADASGN